MNTNLRALIFGAAVAATLTLSLGTVTAAETPQIVRLDGIEVTAHRENFDVDGNLKVVRLEGVTVSAHKDVL